MQSQKVAHQGPPPPDPGLYPKQFCEWLIQRIAATDKEGFFMASLGVLTQGLGGHSKSGGRHCQSKPG